jgi:hypothetical protein
MRMLVGVAVLIAVVAIGVWSNAAISKSAALSVLDLHNQAHLENLPVEEVDKTLVSPLRRVASLANNLGVPQPPRGSATKLRVPTLSPIITGACSERGRMTAQGLVVPRGGPKHSSALKCLACPTIAIRSIDFQSIFSRLSHDPDATCADERRSLADRLRILRPAM